MARAAAGSNNWLMPSGPWSVAEIQRREERHGAREAINSNHWQHMEQACQQTSFSIAGANAYLFSAADSISILVDARNEDREGDQFLIAACDLAAPGADWQCVPD